MKNPYRCITCNKEFDNTKECSKHADLEKHYEFDVAGTKLRFGIL